VFDAWQRIVVIHGVVGKQTHDAHLAAIMQVHAVKSILTFNVSHFERFPGIQVLSPARFEAARRFSGTPAFPDEAVRLDRGWRCIPASSEWEERPFPNGRGSVTFR
jgi:hypothetical protein